MSTRSKPAPKKQQPAWMVPVLIGVIVLAVAFVVWKGMGGGSSPLPPNREVRPGMINFRDEVMKGNVGKRRRESGSGGM